MIPIKNHNDYLITEFGTIFSIKSNKWLKPILYSRGYYMVHLCNNGVITRYSIHRLIGTHFIPNPDNKPLINHINGVKIDNRVENLEWCTSSENNRHAHKMGLNYISDLNKIKRGIKV